jgi:hypothetical protein
MHFTLRFAALSTLISLVTSLSFPVFFNAPYPHPPGPTFDRDVTKLYLREIQQLKPQIVFLGDSILTKGVDAAVFEEEIKLTTYKMDIPGSASALWYLAVKSNIAPSNPPPRYLIILFRDTLLTAPAFRATGPYFGLIDKFAGQKDELLLERAYLAQLSPLQAALEMYFPLYTYRAEVRESLDAGLRHSLPSLVDCDSECADDTMQIRLSDIQPDIFGASIIRAEQDLYAPERLNFAAQVERSFLPETVRLAQARGVQLIFVRAPTRIFPNIGSEPDGLKTYMTDLTGYLAERDIPLLDLGWVAGIGSEHFTDPHHMSPEGKEIFTAVLVDAMKDLLK